VFYIKVTLIFHRTGRLLAWTAMINSDVIICKLFQHMAMLAWVLLI